MEKTLTAEQELREYLNNAPKADINIVEKWKKQGKTAEEILDFIKSWW